MFYTKGDIFDKTNVIFKESSKRDISLHGHPMLIPIDIDFTDNHYYFFTISSNLKYYAADPDRYFPIPKGNGSGLTKPSLVDLKHVYKERKQSHNIRGSLRASDATKLIEKFIDYANKNTDGDCIELLDNLSSEKI